MPFVAQPSPAAQLIVGSKVVQVRRCHLGGAAYAWLPARHLLLIERDLAPDVYLDTVADAITAIRSRRRRLSLAPVTDAVARVVGFTTHSLTALTVLAVALITDVPS